MAILSFPVPGFGQLNKGFVMEVISHVSWNNAPQQEMANKNDEVVFSIPGKLLIA
jgi:hypothetical protein